MSETAEQQGAQDSFSAADEQQGDRPAGEQDAQAPRAQETQSPGHDGETDSADMRSMSEQHADEAAEPATEQWLRRIPDDPGGLLRRKFLYQYQQRERRAQAEDEPW